MVKNTLFSGIRTIEGRCYMEEKKISGTEVLSIIGSLGALMTVIGLEMKDKKEEKAKEKAKLEAALTAARVQAQASQDQAQAIMDQERQTQDALRVRLHVVELELANRDHEEAMSNWNAQGQQLKKELQGATPEAIGYLVEKLVEHRLAKPVLRQIRAY
jgi:hypothetical protein